jgi:RimJ/RimL family protein N-acetyltransferase
MFASIRKDTGEYIGETGIANYRRGLGDSFDKFGEAGWIFSGLVHGQGYAFEAAQAAHKWYHNHMGQNRTVCLIDPDNTSSLKLATRLGYAAFDSKIYKGRAMVMLEREGSA